MLNKRVPETLNFVLWQRAIRRRVVYRPGASGDTQKRPLMDT